MKKTYGIMIGAAIVVAGGLMGAAMIPSPASAAVAVNDDGSLKLFGDARLRYEYDNRRKAALASEHRDRFRLRARLGVVYDADDIWSMGLRLRTESDALNSPHQTTGFFGSSGRNQDFGLDRVYVKVKLPVLGGKVSVWGGKNGMNLWQQDEVWWDTDIQPEGIAGTFKTNALPIAGTLTVNGGGFILSEGNFESATLGNHDGALATVQGVYQTKMFGPKLTVAVTYAKIINPEDLSVAINKASGKAGPPTTVLQSSRYTGASVQIKGSNWRIGGDIIDSNSQTQDAAYVVQARYKPAFLHGIGLRVYYYRVEGFSVLGDGIFTQDNFANPGSFGLTNFRGQRYQIDYKFNKHVSMDLRAYIAKQLDAATGTLQSGGTVTDALMSRVKHDRYQVNLNVKF